MKKLITLTATVAVLASLAACGSSSVPQNTTADTKAETEAKTEAESKEETTEARTAEESKEETSENVKSEYARELKYRRMPTATSDLFEGGVAPILEAQGYTLTPVEITDSIQREMALSEGEIDFHVDANTAYLKNFNKEQGTNLIGVTEIPTVPTGLYPGKKDSLEDIEEGDSIAFPDDAANTARSLYLLESNELLVMDTTKEKSQYTLQDIKENPLNLQFTEMKGASIPGVRDDFDYVILRGSDAYNAGVDFNTAIAREKPESILQASRMVVAVNGENENEGWVQDIVNAYHSEEFKKYLDENGDFWIRPDYLQ